MHGYKNIGRGDQVWDWEDVEIIFRNSIDSKQICEIIPLYQTNKEYKSSQ